MKGVFRNNSLLVFLISLSGLVKTSTRNWLTLEPLDWSSLKPFAAQGSINLVILQFSLRCVSMIAPFHLPNICSREHLILHQKLLKGETPRSYRECVLYNLLGRDPPFWDRMRKNKQRERRLSINSSQSWCQASSHPTVNWKEIKFIFTLSLTSFSLLTSAQAALDFIMFLLHNKACSQF